jgi:hypothetical protein
MVFGEEVTNYVGEQQTTSVGVDIVPPLKEMAHALMVPVDGLRIDPIEVAHPAHCRRLGRLDEQMVVIVDRDVMHHVSNLSNSA